MEIRNGGSWQGRGGDSMKRRLRWHRRLDARITAFMRGDAREILLKAKIV